MFSEENIIVLMKNAQPEDLHRAAEIFDRKSQYDTYIFGGEALVDLMILSDSQKDEIRKELGFQGIFSDGTGEPGDVALYFSGEVELCDDGNLIVTGYTFITEDKSEQAEEEVDNFHYATPHPTPEQVRNLFIPKLAKAS